MAAASPSPNSPPLTIPPAPVSTRTPPPPQASSPPPTPPTSSPSSQPNANPPETTNSTASSPLTPPSPPPTMPLSPPPQPPVVSPPQSAPPTSPPSNPRSPPPTPSSGVPPTSTSGSSLPPETSPPPPALSSTPPMGSPPPPSFFPPFNSPPPPSPTPPKSSPPPPLAESPQTPPPPPPPPPPPSTSPESPPPPPAFPPPQSASPPPPPRSFPPISSPPPTPPFIFPRRSPPPPALPPRNAPPPPAPGSNPTPPPANPPPSSPIRKHPPPSSPMPRPPHSRVPISPPDGATLNDTVPNLPGSAIIDDGGIGTGGVIAIGVVTGLIVLSLIGFVVWFIKKKNQNITGHGGHIVPSPQRTAPIAGPALKAHSPAPIFVGSPVEPGRLGNPISCFTFQVLYEATSGFSDQNLLGQGGSSSVYKGILSGGKEIAVKQLKTSGGQGEEEFKAEVEIVSRIHHRHLVSLVGYCISKNRRLLVFDYVPNNTLHYHLHGEGRPVLDWATRHKVAIGAARGIAYLHEDCHPRVIHRDIKSSNILLDENFKARVSDFGLAKVAPDGQTHVSTGLAGTFGYVAPEYASSGKVTEKSDVYSYGVVLLELITGRKPLDTSQPLDDPSLVAWARPLLRPALEKDELDGLVDPRLERNFVQKEMHTMIRIAAACVRHSSARRPQMGDVIKVFDDLAAVDINNGLKAGESEVVNAAQLKQLQRLAFGIQDYNTDIPSKGSSKRRNSRLKIG